MKIKVYVAIWGILGEIPDIHYHASLEDAKESARYLFSKMSKWDLLSVDTPVVEEHTVDVPARIGKSDILTICGWIFADLEREEKFWLSWSAGWSLENELDEAIKQKEAKEKCTK